MRTDEASEERMYVACLYPILPSLVGIPGHHPSRSRCSLVMDAASVGASAQTPSWAWSLPDRMAVTKSS
jgi:hypothetical protein